MSLLRTLGLGGVFLLWFLGVGVPVFGWLSQVNWGGVFQQLADSSAWSVAGLTLQQAFWSTVWSALLGVPLGLWIGGIPARSPRERSWQAWTFGVLRFPFVLPATAAGTAYLGLIGTQGLLTHWIWPGSWSYSVKAVIFSHVAFNLTWVALRVAEERSQIPAQLEEAARVLGAGARLRWARLWLPELLPALISSLIFVFQACVVSFTLVLLLGGGPPVETLETSIYSQIHLSGGDWEGALPFALLQMAMTLFPVVVSSILSQSVFRETLSRQRLRVSNGGGASWKSPSLREPPFDWNRLTATGVAFLIGIAPYFIGIVDAKASVLRDRDLHEAVYRSLRLILISLPVAMILGVGSASGVARGARSAQVWDRWMARALGLFVALTPGFSALVLCLAFWRVYETWVDPFEGSLLAIGLLQAIGVYPLIHRGLYPAFASPQTRLLDAARVLGSSPWGAFWSVEWPRLSPVLWSMTGLAAGLLLGEVSTVTFFKGESGMTLPLLIAHWVRRYRFDEALMGSLVLISLAAGAVWIIPVLAHKGSRMFRKDSE